MSRSSHKIRAGRGAAALAVATFGVLGAAGAASATGAPVTPTKSPDCSVQPKQFVVQPVGLEHPLTGGTGDAQLPDKNGKPTVIAPGKVMVGVDTTNADITGKLKAGCKFTIQLDLYATQGATWPTSGTQTFVGDLMFTIDKDHHSVTLDFTKLPKTDACFVQYDILDNANVYDGKGQFKVPHFDDVHMDGLIAGWNGPNPFGGTGCAKPSPKPSESESPKPKPSESDSDKPSKKPSASESESAKESESESPKASESDTPEAEMSQATGVQLAHTGGSGADPLVIGGAAASLLVAGGAAMFIMRSAGKYQRYRR